MKITPNLSYEDRVKLFEAHGQLPRCAEKPETLLECTIAPQKPVAFAPYGIARIMGQPTHLAQG